MQYEGCTVPEVRLQHLVESVGSIAGSSLSLDPWHLQASHEWEEILREREKEREKERKREKERERERERERRVGNLI